MSATISEGGERLRVFLDGTHVETRWISNYHVVWQTGQRNGPAQGDPAHHTHCSAYVAAAALYLDIYILRPPHHGQLHLANAQVCWLQGAGGDPGPTAADLGWRTLGASGKAGVLDDAIAAANAGQLVVAGYFQPPTKQPDGRRPRRLLPSVRCRFGHGKPELFALPRVTLNRVPLCEGFLPICLADESEQPRQLFMQIVPFVND